MRVWRHFGSVVWTVTAVILLCLPVVGAGTAALSEQPDSAEFTANVMQLRADVAALANTPAGKDRAAMADPFAEHVEAAATGAPEAADSLLEAAAAQIDELTSESADASDAAVAELASITDALAAVAGGSPAPLVAEPAPQPSTTTSSVPTLEPLDPNDLNPNVIPRPEVAE